MIRPSQLSCLSSSAGRALSRTQSALCVSDLTTCIYLGDKSQTAEAPPTFWHQVMDSNSNHPYYWNPATNEVLWTLPDGGVRSLLPSLSLTHICILRMSQCVQCVRMDTLPVYAKTHTQTSFQDYLLHSVHTLTHTDSMHLLYIYDNTHTLIYTVCV